MRSTENLPVVTDRRSSLAGDKRAIPCLKTVTRRDRDCKRQRQSMPGMGGHCERATAGLLRKLRAFCG